MAYTVKVVSGLSRIEYVDDIAASSCAAVDRAIDYFGGCSSVVAKAIFTEESSAKFLPEHSE